MTLFSPYPASLPMRQKQGRLNWNFACASSQQGFIFLEDINVSAESFRRPKFSGLIVQRLYSRFHFIEINRLLGKHKYFFDMKNAIFVDGFLGKLFVPIRCFSLRKGSVLMNKRKILRWTDFLYYNPVSLHEY